MALQVAELFVQRQQVGQRLAGVLLVGERVDHVQPRRRRRELHQPVLRKRPDHHARHPAFEVAGDVGNRLAFTHGDVLRRRDHVAAQLAHGNLEGAARPQRRLLEQQRHVLPGQRRRPVAAHAARALLLQEPPPPAARRRARPARGRAATRSAACGVTATRSASASVREARGGMAGRTEEGGMRTGAQELRNTGPQDHQDHRTQELRRSTVPRRPRLPTHDPRPATRVPRLATYVRYSALICTYSLLRSQVHIVASCVPPVPRSTLTLMSLR